MTVLQHVLPRAMQVSPEGLFVPSSLLREAPTLENGGLSQNPFTVTFRISDGAVWDDGSPITSTDFAFTWRAAVSSPGSIWAGRYGHIQAVDTSDATAATLRFSEPYAPWPELFGGSFGFVLKASAFPEEAGDLEPDLSDQLMDGIPFSGGPFTLTKWSRDRAGLVRNDRYFGSRALLDRVAFVPITDPAAEFGRFLKGEVQALFPGLEVARLLESLALTPGVQAEGGSGIEVEALWFDLSTPPLDDLRVRYALAHAIDRQGLIDEIVPPVARTNPLNCGLLALPEVGPWCATQPFARFDYDPAESRRYLRQSGYDCSNLICTKDGEELTIDYMVPPSSQFQLDIRAFLIERARWAGILLRPAPLAPPFGMLPCPLRGVAVTGCARAAPIDPSVTDLISLCPLPPANQAFDIAWCNSTASYYARQADRELDPDRRRGLMDTVYDQEAGDAIGLPLFAVPVLMVWRADRIAGPITAYGSTVYGMFFNMNAWYLREA